MQKILKIKSYIGLFVALFIIFLCVFEIVDYKANPIEYERVYHIGSESVGWKYKNAQNFITWNVGLIGLAVLYIVANSFYLFKFKQNKLLKVFLLFIEIGWLIWAIWSLFDWYSVGFDH